MDFLQELLLWSEQHSMALKSSKALRIARLCRARGHFELADRINKKYSRFLPKSDSAMAFAMALQAYSIKKQS